MSSGSKTRTPCEMTVDSVALPGHTHDCIGDCKDGMHMCSKCGQWWFWEVK